MASPSPSSELPLSTIPGSYGLPFFGPIKDRWDFFYFQGRDEFFRSRMEKYNSTVFRANMPPGPWISHEPRVVVLLDAKSYPVLFDISKVEKRDAFTGTYSPSTTFTGGFRTCPYLDPSEREHGSLKSLFLSVLASQHDEITPLFQRCLEGMFPELEAQLESTGQADFGPPNDVLALEFIFRLFCDGKSPLDTKLESNGPGMLQKWIFLQVAPMVSLEVPLFNPIEDLILHSFRMPFQLVKGDYRKLYDVFSSSAKSFFDKAESFGLSKEEACHNLICVVGFNSFAVSKWFPSLMSWVASAGESLHQQLAEEIRAVVKSEGGITFNALNKMALTKSVVYEALRIEPPTPFQFGKAKEDLVIESHDAAFKIKKGEMLLGYQPFATNDPKIFEDPKTFIGSRFVGEEGEKLLKYVYWSNGRGVDDPTVENKQCPAKNMVEHISMVLLVEFFLRYDTFTIKVGNYLSFPTVTFLSLKKASSG